MAISEKAKAVTQKIYNAYGSGTGYLFGIPPEHRYAVEAIVDVVLEHDWPGVAEDKEDID